MEKQMMYLLTDLLIILIGMFVLAWFLAGFVNMFLDIRRERKRSKLWKEVR